MPPRIGKGVRCSVRASQVKNADPRVDIISLFGAGNGGAPLFGTVAGSTAAGVYEVVFDVLRLDAGWRPISVARKYITTLDETEYAVARGQGPQVRCAVIPLRAIVDESSANATNSGATQEFNSDDVAAAIAQSVGGLTNSLRESIVSCMQESFRNFQKMSPPTSIPKQPNVEATPNRSTPAATDGTHAPGTADTGTTDMADTSTTADTGTTTAAAGPEANPLTSPTLAPPATPMDLGIYVDTVRWEKVDAVTTDVRRPQQKVSLLQGVSQPLLHQCSKFDGRALLKLRGLLSVGRPDLICRRMNKKMRADGILPARCRDFDADGLKIFKLLISIGCLFPEKGMNLFDKDMAGVVPQVDFNQWMPRHRFLWYKKYLKWGYAPETEWSRAINDNTWDMFLPWCAEHKRQRAHLFSRPADKDEMLRSILDELMSARIPETTQFGGMPNLTLEPRKPDSFGTMFKNKACCVTGVSQEYEPCVGAVSRHGREKDGHLHLHEGPLVKEPSGILGGKPIGVQSACTVRMMSTLKDDTYKLHDEFGQEPMERKWEDSSDFGVLRPIGATTYGDSWFSSLMVAYTAARQGQHYVGIVKSMHAGLPVDAIYEELKYKDRGSHVVYATELNGIKIWVTGYLFSQTQPANILIHTCGVTTPGRPHGTHYEDQYGNRVRVQLPRPAIVTEYFSGNTMIDDRNHLRQHELALAKSWPTKCPWFKLHVEMIGETEDVDMYQLLRYSGVLDADKWPIRRWLNMAAQSMLTYLCPRTDSALTAPTAAEDGFGLAIALGDYMFRAQKTAKSKNGGKRHNQVSCRSCARDSNGKYKLTTYICEVCAADGQIRGVHNRKRCISHHAQTFHNDLINNGDGRRTRARVEHAPDEEPSSDDEEGGWI